MSLLFQWCAIAFGLLRITEAGVNVDNCRSSPSSECGAAGVPRVTFSAGADDEVSDDEISPVLLQTEYHLMKSATGADATHDSRAAFADHPSEVEPSFYGDGQGTTKTTTHLPTGLTLNAHGDLKVFMSGIFMYGFLAVFMYVVFSYIWWDYPLMYYHNHLTGEAPPLPRRVHFPWPKDISRKELVHDDKKTEKKVWSLVEDKPEAEATSGGKQGEASSSSKQPEPTAVDDKGTPRPSLKKCKKFAWIKASVEVRIEDVIQSSGLDAAMMLELSHLGMKIFMTVGLPIVCIMAPLNLCCGGDAAKDDHLSVFSFGNVEFENWLYNVYPIVIWYVVIVVEYYCWHAMKDFLPKRKEWLKEMEDTRATTLLVEGIPSDHNTEAKVFKVFEDLCSGKKAVKEVYMIKDTTETDKIMQEIKYYQQQEMKLQLQWEADEKDVSKRPMIKESMVGGEQVDGLNYYRDKIVESKAELKTKQKELIEASKQEDNKVNLPRAFVRFDSRLTTEIILRMSGEVTTDYDEWVITKPPAAEDVTWDELIQDPSAEFGRHVLGYVLTLGLFFAYMPLVIGIQKGAAEVDPPSPLNTLWDLVTPTIGTMIVVAFLPTVLLLIFKHCFTLRAAQFSQHKLQKWYFWFQLFFLVFAAAIGRNFTKFAEDFGDKPTKVLRTLADTLPFSTHFYMNYYTLTYMTKAMVVLRHTPVIKFFLASKVWGQIEAKKLAEPEDQDYYGTGGRMSRWTIFIVMGLVYGTMSPPINVLAFILFAEIRLSYGFLIPYAETRKPDLGGEFYVTALYHIQIGALLYAMVMCGVLGRRAESPVPSASVVPLLFLVPVVMWRMSRKFQWETLPLETMTERMPQGTKEGKVPYRQPSLDPDLCK